MFVFVYCARMEGAEHLCQDTLLSLLRFDREPGKLFWRERKPEMFPSGSGRQNNSCAIWNSRYAGTEAAALTRHGYLRMSILGKTVLAHRVVWAIEHGEWPNGHIDHINGIRTDNRVENLRVVSVQENNKNTSRARKNSTGACGVYRFRGKFRAQIGSRGKQIHLGCFNTLEDAVAARRKAERDLGFHANHGRDALKTTL